MSYPPLQFAGNPDENKAIDLGLGLGGAPIKKKPLFVPSTPQTIAPMGQAPTIPTPGALSFLPGAINENLKKVVAGRGLIGVLNNKPAPATYGQALREPAQRFGQMNPHEQGLAMVGSFGPASLENASSRLATKAAQEFENQAPKIFKGFKDLTTRVLEDLKGKATVSKQYIENLTNQGSLRQPERDLIRETLQESPKNVSAKDFADKVKAKLLPLERKQVSNPRWENITLDKAIRGKVANYSEHIYESPIKTSGTTQHFPNVSDNYFAHARVEDLGAPKTIFDNKFTLEMSKTDSSNAKIWEKLASKKDVDLSNTRRIVEIQSDLFQKGRLENELKTLETMSKDPRVQTSSTKLKQEVQQLNKLQPYRNTWYERITREEIKRAAQDGKTKLQFPTGETAMKIEGLGGDTAIWQFHGNEILGKDNLKTGLEIRQGTHIESPKWIITDVLGDGKFKAVPKQSMEMRYLKGLTDKQKIERLKNTTEAETFDISGKVDTSNPIYKFYEKDIQKFLKRIHPDMQKVTDKQGVSWFEIPIKKQQANEPVLHYGKASLKTILGTAGATAAVIGGKKILDKLAPKPYTYNRAEQPVKVVDKKSDLMGPYYVLNTGTKVRPPNKYRKAIMSTYREHPELPTGILESILMQESSMGTHKAQYNPNIGEYAWLVGFTKAAESDLERNGISVNLDTKEGAIKALGDYLALRQNVKDEQGRIIKTYKNPVKLYRERYGPGNLTPEQVSHFNDLIKYYKKATLLVPKT